MFLNLKTKIKTKIAKNKIIILLILLLFMLFFVIHNLIPKDKMIMEADLIEVPKENDLTVINSKNIICGSDIKKNYEQVIDTDYAILVTTLDFLKGVDTNENSDNYRYILNNDNTNIISTIEDKYGNSYDAILINYNRLLKDSVVIKDISGGYMAPYGFTDDKKKKYNKYNKRDSIVINDKAEFLDYPVYDADYNQIGVMYIEKDD